MFKMKELCELTGLTERAIRLYIEEELIVPETREGAHNKAYFFGEKDVERLRDISTLRNAGFGIAEIKQMLENPANIAILVQQRIDALEEEINHLKYVRETLKFLSIQEYNSVTKLADAIEPRSRYAKETLRYKKPRWVIVLVVVLVILLILIPHTLQMGPAFYLYLAFALGILGGISFPIMSVGYFGHCVKSRFKRNIATGKVVAIVSNEGIEDYIGESTFATIRQIITFGVIRWNDFRPDHWFPLVQFQTGDGQIHTSTFRYGGFKHFWTIGEELEIAWDDEKTIYPRDIRWLLKKAVLHLLAGVAMLALSGGIYLFYIK